MSENAAGPVNGNTYYCFSLDFEAESCIYKGFFSLPIHWSWYNFKRNKVSVNQTVKSAFCFGQRRQLCCMSESILAPFKY